MGFVFRRLELNGSGNRKPKRPESRSTLRRRVYACGLSYPTAPLPPPRSARAATLIQDPLGFELSRLDASGALEIGQWWGSLGPDDRREFARYFGLWCAQQRQVRGGR